MGFIKMIIHFFKTYESSLKNILKFYKYGLWSYYDIKGTIASAFYHRLHIQMLKWLNIVSPDPVYGSYLRRWRIGMNLKIVYVLIKASQKFSHLSKMDTLNT